MVNPVEGIDNEYNKALDQGLGNAYSSNSSNAEANTQKFIANLVDTNRVIKDILPQLQAVQVPQGADASVPNKLIEKCKELSDKVDNMVQLSSDNPITNNDMNTLADSMNNIMQLMQDSAHEYLKNNPKPDTEQAQIANKLLESAKALLS
ncbi:MAG: hypothetical protein P4L16_02185 [Chlamydiales bacterium]|nr:hypothetical protein [Chlamydiales bacterium]